MRIELTQAMKKDTITLPLNCSVDYTNVFLSKEESTQLYTQLITDYEINNLKTAIYVEGKKTLSDYGKIMFMDENLYAENKLPENQWGKTAIWSDELKKIKERVEAFTNRIFHVCVCIYYPDGNSGVGYHSDYVAYGDTSVIASISIGEEREFYLREKKNFKVFDLVLEEGSLLVMGENCQDRYEHSLPTNPKYEKGRINLTFRKYGF